ncbi:hypothetical protein JJB07_05775 [Tumebacillus sp. ITR2]|uniref:Phosphatase n=1 Tax=Tumebacillus amylolyticus TaxID=2801339 RepID=A0ABS1J7D0_9BACL|nr:hypothetical protein [Tumebacillus amylolyticus]MBL0386159.1 hypothetical protein [Tumebacillus amylolyticus]
MKLKVWMGIAVLCSLVIAATGTALVAADDGPKPMMVKPVQLAADDNPEPMTAPKIG